jgi:hypothetical protein
MNSCRLALLERVFLADAVAAMHSGSLLAQTSASRRTTGWGDDPPAISTLVAR